ncbi:Similar to CDase: Neutral ceramidase (Drosophila melanogaster), partial [Cotesia congregata]
NIWNDRSALTELKGPVQVVHQFVKMPGQMAEFFNHTTNQMETVTACYPAMGYSFAAGTTDGPGSFSFAQGTTTTNPMWNAVRNFVAAPTEEDIKCHGAKPILLATGRMRLPYQWQPQTVSTHLAMIGDLVIVGVPGEFTTMSGRRMRETIASTVEEITKARPTVVIAGLCNTYSDYIATPEEYEKKRVDPGPFPRDLTSENLITLQTPVVYDTAKWGKHYGDCIKQPDKIVNPGETVSAIFVSGHPRNNLMTGRTFLTVERLENNTWIEVATDADWETKVCRCIKEGSMSKDIVVSIPVTSHKGYHEYDFPVNDRYKPLPILYFAIAFSDEPMIDYLLSFHPTIEKIQPALLFAIKCKELKGVKKLLAAGGNINDPILFSTAVYSNSTEIAKFFINHGAPVDSKLCFEGCLPLVRAAVHDNVEIMKILIDNGADVNILSSIDGKNSP